VSEAPSGEAPLSFFLVAGEPSGDVLGARLMGGLRALAGDRVRFAGVGGERMEAAGLASVFPLEDIAVMGLLQVVPRLPVVLRRIRDTVAAIAAAQPDAVVTIDAPSFTLRVARRARRAGATVVHYVAPQYWGWRPGRLRKLPQKVDHLMALFPFEPAFFARGTVPTTYVGHPAIEQVRAGDAAGFRARHGVAADARVVAVLPGSRAHLVERMLPIFAATIARVAQGRRLHIVIPTLAARRARIVAAVAGWPVPVTIVDAGMDAGADRRDGLAAAEAALTVSGTITTELAVLGLPMVVGYRVDELSARLVRPLITVKYAAMPNLILGREVVPELIQWDCTAERLAAALAHLLDDPAAAAAQRGGLDEVARALGAGGESPSLRAARVVLDVARHARAARNSALAAHV
jgi:lipid-A-disaccharide synthase